MTKLVDLKSLEYFAKRMKEYIDVKTELTYNKKTNCPNCGAAITGMKCEYCDTDFEAIMRIGQEINKR